MISISVRNQKLDLLGYRHCRRSLFYFLPYLICQSFNRSLIKNHRKAYPQMNKAQDHPIGDIKIPYTAIRVAMICVPTTAKSIMMDERPRKVLWFSLEILSYVLQRKASDR